MKFSEMVDQARVLLQRTGKLTYRMLKREFALDDEELEDLKEQLIDAEALAVDQDGKVLVWVGEGSKGEKAKEGNGEKEGTPGQWTPPHLAERIRAATVTEGERKTITALFADLKGSTALIEGLDPEEARAIIDPALQLMMDAVHQYDGYVAQALGDGIFALFGAPLAHEDHPQRALYAALRMQEAMRRYTDTLRQKGYAPLLMRVGLNTGEVVLRSLRKDDLHTDYVPVDHSTNLAARMEQLATPGTILVSAYTHRLTDGYFAFKDLGPTQIKGVEAPLHIYEVLGAGPLRTRLQVAARRGLTRFVGRQSEMEQLKKALEQAKAGHGQIVGTMGEPGLGKSRLFYEFVGARRAVPLLAHGCLVLEAYSVSHGKATAYLPVIELLKSYFQIESQDDERTRRAKVMGQVLVLDRSLEDTLPYLFALLGIEEQPSPLHQMDAQIRRRRTFEALKRLFLRESLNQPLILIFEDLHWIDDETQGFLDVLSESVASARILLLTNYRPEYRHEWGQKTYCTQLRLAPFGQAEAEEFLDVLLGDHSSPQPSPQRGEGASPRPSGERARGRGMENNLQPLKQLILDKTQGTPFFMEEIVQDLVEQGVLVRDGVGAGFKPAPTMPSRPDLHLPPTVQGILAARIDRLAPDEKALLQQLSVIGREFPLSLVRQVITQPEADLYRLLASLQRKEFLYEQPAFPEVEYLFKHALTQEVAYGTVLQEQRKRLHEHTARAIEALNLATLDDHYSELAHHYSRSGNAAKAVEYLSLAGQQAARHSANAEAINHLTAALELFKTLPDSRERDERELAMQIALIAPLVATKGYTAAELENVYIRARTLCQHVGGALQLFPIMWGLYVFAMVRAECKKAHELAEQLLRLAQKEQNSAFLVQAHAMLGDTLFKLGEFSSARSHFEQSLSFYDPKQHHMLSFLYGQDTKVVALSYLPLALWFLGYPEQALKKIHEVLAFARELSHPLSLAWAFDWTAVFHQYLRDRQTTRERAEAAVAISTEHGFPYFAAWGTVLRGWALHEPEQEESIDQIRQGLAAYRANGAEVWRPYFLALLAEALGKMGQVEEGFAVLSEALTTVDATGECNYKAELYRIKGELLLQQASQKSKGKSQKSKIETDP